MSELTDTEIPMVERVEGKDSPALSLDQPPVPVASRRVVALEWKQQAAQHWALILRENLSLL